MAAIVLFDGVCNFCNASVNFIIERDRSGYFKFAPLQSKTGEELMRKFDIDSTENDSIVLVEDERAYTHSTAAFRIASKLDGYWPWLKYLSVVPRPVRDLFYRLFAANRYRVFGRQDACMIPTPELKARFIA